MTLTQIRTRCKQQCDLENSYFILDEEWNYLINESYKELWELLVTTWEDYFVSSLEFTIASGETAYNLPSDFLKLRGIDLEVNSVSRWLPITRFNFQERHKYGTLINNLSWNTRPPVQYKVMGSQILFEPGESAPGNYKLWYVPKVTELVADIDIINTVCEIWVQYIIADVCIKANTKQEMDIRPFVKMKEDQIQRIKDSAVNRDSAQTGRIADVEDSGYGDYWYPFNRS